MKKNLKNNTCELSALMKAIAEYDSETLEVLSCILIDLCADQRAVDPLTIVSEVRAMVAGVNAELGKFDYYGG